MRGWSFIFFYSDPMEEKGVDDLLSMPEHKTQIVYGIHSREYHGALFHLRGYIYTNRSRTIYAIRKYFEFDRAYIGPATWAPLREIAFCKANKGFVEWGNTKGMGRVSEPGYRIDFGELSARVIDAGSLEVASEGELARYGRAMCNLLDARLEPHTGPRYVVWIFGGTRRARLTHAQTLARCAAEGGMIYTCAGIDHEFHDYSYQRVAVIHEIVILPPPSVFDPSALVRLLGEEPIRVGGAKTSRPWMAEAIVITSSDMPPGLISAADDSCSQKPIFIQKVNRFFRMVPKRAVQFPVTEPPRKRVRLESEDESWLQFLNGTSADD